VRHTKTDRQAKAEHNGENKKGNADKKVLKGGLERVTEGGRVERGEERQRDG